MCPSPRKELEYWIIYLLLNSFEVWSYREAFEEILYTYSCFSFCCCKFPLLEDASTVLQDLGIFTSEKFRLIIGYSYC